MNVAYKRLLLLLALYSDDFKCDDPADVTTISITSPHRMRRIERHGPVLRAANVPININNNSL